MASLLEIGTNLQDSFVLGVSSFPQAYGICSSQGISDLQGSLMLPALASTWTIKCRQTQGSSKTSDKRAQQKQILRALIEFGLTFDIVNIVIAGLLAFLINLIYTFKVMSQSLN